MCIFFQSKHRHKTMHHRFQLRCHNFCSALVPSSPFHIFYLFHTYYFPFLLAFCPLPLCLKEDQLNPFRIQKGWSPRYNSLSLLPERLFHSPIEHRASANLPLNTPWFILCLSIYVIFSLHYFQWLYPFIRHRNDSILITGIFTMFLLALKMQSHRLISWGLTLDRNMSSPLSKISAIFLNNTDWLHNMIILLHYNW